MTKIFQLLAFLLFFQSLLSAQEPSTTLITKLETCLQEAAAKGWSGAALVAKGGTVLIEKGFGYA
ncbi:MAG: hypothetical protein KA138_12030, partial [Saprospiraceae bacterium]|nr:hypothetical protein [Saprospiraceae bacterium]